MCGIVGYWNYGSGRPAELSTLRAMVGTLRHRGPDEEGCWIDGTVALGIRRLRIIDPAGGRQPIAGEDGAVRVVFNGEIYNHRELRRELEVRGHRFRTLTDTEAIVHAFEEWGPACVRRFNGMFALAVWDARQRQLFLARDRLGIKPLYIHEGADGVVFGSELKSVIAAPWVPVDWDLEALDDFMVFEYVPAPRSIVRSVRKLAAGCSLLYADRPGGRPRADRYWRLEAGVASAATPAEAAAELRHHLLRSVRRRMVADVPVGAFLSGGIDSSIIAALMAGRAKDPICTVSLGFADQSYDELPYARLVAGHLGTRHREAVVTPDVVGVAERLADHFDEPFGDVSAFPTFLVSELARREVTVALSGDGGDELFAGYDHYRADRWARRIRWFTAAWPWRHVDRLLDRLPPGPHKKGSINIAKRFSAGLRHPADLEHARWWVFGDVADRRALYAAGLAGALEGRDHLGFYRERLAEAARAGFSGLARQLYADLTGYLADDILVKVDRMSMAVSLEARVPFLDHEVVEYAMAIPAAWKLRGGETKRILRQAFRDLLPPRIRRRGKEGFSIPMKHWLRAELRPLLHELLDTRRVRERGWFRPSEVRRLIDEHLDGRQNHAHRLWCLMSVELSMAALEDRARRRPQAEREVVA